MTSFADWQYEVDREATVASYRLVERGGSDTCNCIWCRNFRLARQFVFPADFIAQLDRFGIDPSKDAEVYYNGPVAPGRHHYGGWFHFVGSIEGEGDSPHIRLADTFETWLCPASAPRLSSLVASRVVQLEFIAEAVPWLLDEPEQA